jgi:hypothetical protein
VVENRGFLVFNVAVMEKCCEACGDGNTISGSLAGCQRVSVFEGHRLPSTGSRWDIRWVSGSGKPWFSKDL